MEELENKLSGKSVLVDELKWQGSNKKSEYVSVPLGKK